MNPGTGRKFRFGRGSPDNRLTVLKSCLCKLKGCSRAILRRDLSMHEITNILLGLNDETPDIYPDKSIHSIKIEGGMPIWDEAGSKDFSTMIDKMIQVVFVCFINRSGSNYLLDLIEQLDLGAKPTDEALNYDQVIARCRKNGITNFSSYLAKIIIANAKGGFCFLKVG